MPELNLPTGWKDWIHFVMHEYKDRYPDGEEFAVALAELALLRSKAAKMDELDAILGAAKKDGVPWIAYSDEFVSEPWPEMLAEAIKRTMGF